MTVPLIGPEQHFAVWAALVALAAFGFWCDTTSWGRRFTGVGIMLVAAIVLSNLGVIPMAAPAYEAVWSYLVPVAIPLLLLKADMRKILPKTGPTMIGFAIGAFGTILGAVIGLHMLDLGENGAALSGIFSATYIGGSMNFAAVSEALEFNDAGQLTAAVAADNVVGTLFFLVLVSLPSMALVRRFVPLEIHDRPQEQTVSEGSDESQTMPLRLLDISLALALSLALCAVGYGTAAAFGIESYGILLVTAAAVAIANLIPARLAKLTGDFEIGIFFMFIFFASIGAGADIPTLIEVGPVLAIYATIILVVHLAVILLGGKLFGLDLAEVVIASTACVLGPPTAAALAAGKGWRSLVTPGVMCGVLGYAIANFIGVGMAKWLS